VDELNILITGLPRSGTTLTCELLGGLPDAVALDEPLDRAYLIGDTAPQASPGILSRIRARAGRPVRSGGSQAGPVSPEDVCRRVDQFIRDTRESALSRGVVRTKSVDGRVIGRKVSDDRDVTGVRVGLVRVGEVSVDKPLTPDFLLAIKQCGGFTAVLEALVSRFAVFALVRNPLSVLVSWQSVPMPVRDGHVPLAERLNPTLAMALSAIDDPIDRQFHLLDWFFGEYARLLPRDSIVSYESIVASGGQALKAIAPRASGLDRPLVDRNRDRPRGDDPALLKRLGTRLVDTDGPWWGFYSRDDVVNLLSELTPGGE
jgi:hypothetical protein